MKIMPVTCVHTCRRTLHHSRGRFRNFENGRRPEGLLVVTMETVGQTSQAWQQSLPLISLLDHADKAFSPSHEAPKRGLPLHPPVSLGFLVPLCRKRFGLSIFACFRVPRNLWNVTAKVKGQGHCKNGRFHEISIFWDIFGNIIAAFFKYGMWLDPMVTHFPRSYNWPWLRSRSPESRSNDEKLAKKSNRHGFNCSCLTKCMSLEVNICFIKYPSHNLQKYV